MPHAIERLREVRRTPAGGRLVTIGTTDPLNLAGIVTSGDGSTAVDSTESQATFGRQAGGWNRVVLRVTDLLGCIAELGTAGLHCRNDMETGPGGRQIQVEDPDGNPIELFEPAR